MKPSERIEQLVGAIAAERLSSMKVGDESISASTIEFMQTITGTSDADMLESMKRDPLTWVGAVIAYLDEIDERKDGHGA